MAKLLTMGKPTVIHVPEKQFIYVGKMEGAYVTLDEETLKPYRDLEGEQLVRHMNAIIGLFLPGAEVEIERIGVGG